MDLEAIFGSLLPSVRRPTREQLWYAVELVCPEFRCRAELHQGINRDWRQPQVVVVFAHCLRCGVIWLLRSKVEKS